MLLAAAYHMGPRVHGFAAGTTVDAASSACTSLCVYTELGFLARIIEPRIVT